VSNKFPDGISSEEIVSALKKMSSSDCFVRAPQIQRFLQYVVTEELCGNGDRLKAYSIAVEALRRPSNFDPDTDSIVRVEAVRLRRSLQHYYEFDGKNDTVRICLPTGKYIPVFEGRAAIPSTVDTSSAIRLRYNIPMALLFGALLGAGVLFASLRFGWLVCPG
jgi:hypothetical protein